MLVTDHAILGMPLDVTDDDPITTVQPLCGFIVIKALDGDGEVRYMTAATGGLKSVECLGMARYAVLRLERGLVRQMAGGEDNAGDG